MSQLDTLTPDERARVQHAAYLDVQAFGHWEAAQRGHTIADAIADPVQSFVLRYMARFQAEEALRLHFEARRVVAEMEAV